MKSICFGTDGIRGIYGEEITDETAFRLGTVLGKKGTLILARDNRLSSPRLAAAFLGGVASTGGRCRYIGQATTPSLYYVHTHTDTAYAVMITASHNPPSHNGLKVFYKGEKLSKADREEVAAEMTALPVEDVFYREISEEPEALDGYRTFFGNAVGDLSGVRAVVDYAGGAGGVFGDLLSSLGAEVSSLNLLGSGEKINVGCGALHPEAVRAETVKRKADIGFALDGDGDRIVAVTKEGDVLDGDALLYILARKRKEKGTLRKNRIALTVMTNSGVLRSLSDLSIEVTLCGVGDSAVTAAMRSEGLTLGGEQSGHIVLGDLMMTGDGLLVGGKLMQMIKRGDRLIKPKELIVYPQALLNVPVHDRKVAALPEVHALAMRLKESAGAGRILVRASGTENVVRVMAECPNRRLAEKFAREIATCVKEKDEAFFGRKATD